MTKLTTSILSWGGMRYKPLKTTMAHLGRNFGSFPKEVFKTPIDGNNETQIPEIRLQSSKSKTSRFSRWTSKTVQRRIRNSCPCRHWTVHIRQNATTPEETNKSGSLEEWHVWTICHTPGMGIRAEWFGNPWRATDKHCEPTTHRH